MPTALPINRLRRVRTIVRWSWPFLLLFVLLSSCQSTRVPIGFWSRNRFGKAGLREGPWREYYDSAQTMCISRGRYRHGRPVGRWTYAHPDGYRSRTERYRRHGLVLIEDFHPNGQLAARGQARLVFTADTVHYYWFGTWQRRDDHGQVTAVEQYNNGVLEGTTLQRVAR
ncbi:hypothetical protein F0P96_08015 [Hymenobacter busanensis]|uniref:Uncharacterized protein n=1 Tax=Hymenobacter busanensis TaxID=2607656 RepID=A0A7L5A3F6_9BACT|nr:hypothetical protein [Hymenobacter busanensis]KAA9332926.1 hypothetical protein F0P96_08015 [Hymenobacter busanensis]QHJ08400.1 hypothetical protein GUY19_14315 [Hymenobacter busanensis]